jgi:hypothetical protein
MVYSAACLSGSPLSPTSRMTSPRTTSAARRANEATPPSQRCSRPAVQLSRPLALSTIWTSDYDVGSRALDVLRNCGEAQVPNPHHVCAHTRHDAHRCPHEPRRRRHPLSPTSSASPRADRLRRPQRETPIYGPLTAAVRTTSRMRSTCRAHSPWRTTHYSPSPAREQLLRNTPAARSSPPAAHRQNDTFLFVPTLYLVSQ